MSDQPAKSALNSKHFNKWKFLTACWCLLFTKDPIVFHALNMVSTRYLQQYLHKSHYVWISTAFISQNRRRVYRYAHSKFRICINYYIKLYTLTTLINSTLELSIRISNFVSFSTLNWLFIEQHKHIALIIVLADCIN